MKQFVRRVSLSCECRICLQRAEVVGHLAILEKYELTDQIKFFEDLYLELMSIGLDNDVNKSIIEGSWPTADENIKHAREKYQNRINKS